MIKSKSRKKYRPKKKGISPLPVILIILLLIPVFILIKDKLLVLAVDNPVVIENQNTGTTTWELPQPGKTISDDTNNQIKGYASATSVNKGETITFHVTVNPVQTYTMDIYRMGWYAGAGGRLMRHVDAISGVSQPACPQDSQTGLTECDWSVGYSLTVPDDWTSGVYIVMLSNEQNYQDHMIFTLRDDARTSDFLFSQSVTTYQAYNNYPADGISGKSLYPFNSSGAVTSSGRTSAAKVSFDRPYTSSREGGSGEFLKWEIQLVRWLEKKGYDVAYSTNVDTHTNGARILNYKAFISPPHDEYYSKQMYDSLENARDSGIDLGFFGANSVYWQIRFEPSLKGAPDRTIVCYKNLSLDPVADPALETDKWRKVGKPEQKLVGVIYGDLLSGGNRDFAAKNTSHWAYEGSGMTEGGIVPGIVGYEVDKINSSFPLPQNINNSYTTLGQSPAGTTQVYNSTIYQAPSGSWVFASGTMSWSWALDNYRNSLEDLRIQKMTENVLAKFLSQGGIETPTPSPTPDPSLSPTPAPQVQLIGNPSFEIDSNNDNKPDIWSGSTKFLKSTDLVQDGTYSGKFLISNNSGATITQTIKNLTGGTNYNYSGFVNIPPISDTNFSITLDIVWKSSSGTTLGTSVVKTYTSATNGWDQASSTLTSPAGTNKATVRLVVKKLNGTIYVDNISLAP